MPVTSEEAKSVLSVTIDRRLESLGWSRYRLSHVSGISEQTLANICNGTCEPRISFVARIADALGIPIADLLAVPGNFKKTQKKVAS